MMSLAPPRVPTRRMPPSLPAAAGVVPVAAVVAVAACVAAGAADPAGALVAAGAVLLLSLPQAASAAASTAAVLLPRISCRLLNFPGTKPRTGSNAITHFPLVSKASPYLRRRTLSGTITRVDQLDFKLECQELVRSVSVCPSTPSTWPEMNRAAGDDRNAAASAMSLASTKDPIDTWFS